MVPSVTNILDTVMKDVVRDIPTATVAESANRDITVQTVPWPVHQIVRLVGIWMVFAPVKRVGGIIIVQQNVSSPMEKIANILAVNTALTISVTGSTENVCVMLNMTQMVYRVFVRRMEQSVYFGSLRFHCHLPLASYLYRPHSFYKGSYFYNRSLQQVTLIFICVVDLMQNRLLAQMMHLTIKISVFHRSRTHIKL